MAKRPAKAKPKPQKREEANTMAPPKGNKFWLARSSHGANPKFKNAEQLHKACLEYFEWVVDNPLYVAEKVTYQGKGTLMNVPRMRAMTLSGLCNFLGISVATWQDWRGSTARTASKRDDLLSVIAEAEEIIRQQKFEGAAADLLNANIIARDLGLSDKKEVKGNIAILSDDDEAL